MVLGMYPETSKHIIQMHMNTMHIHTHARTRTHKKTDTTPGYQNSHKLNMHRIHSSQRNALLQAQGRLKQLSSPAK